MPERAVLITRPDYDDATSYLYAWSERIIEAAQKHGARIIDLKRERANRKNFEGIVASKKPGCMLFNGHGTADEIRGHMHETLVKYGENHAVLAGAVVYSRTCDSAAVLGNKSVREGGTKAFIGYGQEFIFFVNNAKTATPMDDDYASPCLIASNAVAEALVAGSSAGDACRKSREQTRKEVEYLLTHYSPRASHIFFALLWNDRALSLHGNPSAKL